MEGFKFSKFIPKSSSNEANFENLLELFMKLLSYTSGDVSETLAWMSELDNQYNITSSSYGMADFIDDLKKNGYISEDQNEGSLELTAKSEQSIRKSALEEIFGKLKKSKAGRHQVSKTGIGDDLNSNIRQFEFGDSLDSIDMTRSIYNAQMNNGIDDFKMTEDDLVIRERDHKTQASTVLMIDISHSMILYGEDRITPAKKVAMALAELITQKYPNDTLDIIVFGNDAWPISIKELPYLKVGPYHTNTYAGLQLAVDILRRKKTSNKQIFMITDGKPTCLKVGLKYYKNSFGLDRKVINKTMNMAAQCKRLEIPITTFMIAKDPYLQQFVKEFTEVNNGRAYYSSLNGLGEYIFEDFLKNRKKTLR